MAPSNFNFISCGFSAYGVMHHFTQGQIVFGVILLILSIANLIYGIFLEKRANQCAN